MRHFGHASPSRTERPDSVIDPYERDFPCEVPVRVVGDSEKLTSYERVVLFAGIGLGGLFGGMVGYGYYVEFLK